MSAGEVEQATESAARSTEIVPPVYRDELDDHIAESMKDPEYAAAVPRPLADLGDPACEDCGWDNGEHSVACGRSRGYLIGHLIARPQDRPLPKEHHMPNRCRCPRYLGTHQFQSARCDLAYGMESMGDEAAGLPDGIPIADFEAMKAPAPTVASDSLPESIETHVRTLLAFDCVTDEVPQGIDVPDDYERGLHDAARGFMQILQVHRVPPTRGGAEATGV